MCGRYRHKLSYDQLRRLTKLAADAPAPNLEPNDDVRPTTRQPVVRPRDPAAPDGERELATMRWGLVPFWFKGPTLKEFKLTTFNAKAETVVTAATFREAYKRRRCLVPASGWYEWTGPKGGKTKWLFTPKDAELITFAGLWETWRGPEGPVESFTLITQPAGAPLNDYHDRAPVVIWPEDHARYLDLAQDPAPLLGPESIDRFHVEQAA